MSEAASTKPDQLVEKQAVKFIPREGPSDSKSLPYYDFYTGLTGKVVKLYPDNTIAVSIDRRSMPEEVLQRHEAAEKAQRDKWLNGLSEEDRTKLTDKQREFSLRYTLLVSARDLQPLPAGYRHPARTAAKPIVAKTAAEVSAEAARISSAEIEAAEQRYLDEIKRRAGEP